MRWFPGLGEYFCVARGVAMGTEPEKTVRDEASEDDLRSDPLVGRLRAIFDEVASEPLPSDLVRLLQQLDEAERKR